MATQWRWVQDGFVVGGGMAGISMQIEPRRVGLDYGPLESIARIVRVKLDARMLELLQAMEAAALDECAAMREERR